MLVEITPRERELVLEILSAYRMDLRTEIARTKESSYKRELTSDGLLLDAIIARLENIAEPTRKLPQPA